MTIVKTPQTKNQLQSNQKTRRQRDQHEVFTCYYTFQKFSQIDSEQGKCGFESYRAFSTEYIHKDC